jgi:adenosine deaminase
MDSTELGVDLRAYADVYIRAARLGLRRTAHAGEDGGPENIAFALDVLGAERIDHGLAILEDTALSARVAERRVPLTVCPSSNILIANKYARLEDHPFRRMRESGLLATLNTDDPAMIELDLGTEYRAVANAFGLDLSALATIALDGVEASWLDESDKRSMRAAFEADLRALRDR